MGVLVLGHADEGATHQGSIIRDLGCLGKPGRVSGCRGALPRPARSAPPVETPHSRRDTARACRCLVAFAVSRRFLHRLACGAESSTARARTEIADAASRGTLAGCRSCCCPHAVRPSPVELYRVARRRDGVPHRCGTSIRLSARARRSVRAARRVGPSRTRGSDTSRACHAYALVNPDAVFSHESAAALLGLPLFGEPRDIHVYDFARTSSNGDSATSSSHTSADDREVVARGRTRR